jgi:hypothetical protein
MEFISSSQVKRLPGARGESAARAGYWKLGKNRFIRRAKRRGHGGVKVAFPFEKPKKTPFQVVK